MRIFVFCFIWLTLWLPVEAQTVVQPKIMVVPFAREGEEYRRILENDPNKRIVLTKIKEAFDNRGVTTVDLIAKLKSITQFSAFQEDNQNSLKKMIVEQSGADIYVEAEINYTTSNSGNSVKIILTAYEISTGNSLANKVGFSGKFYTNDVGALATKAVTKIADEFLSTIQSKYNEIVASGRSIVVNFGFLNTSLLTMDTEVGTEGDYLKDVLEMWIEENAFDNQYHIQGTVSNSMIFDDVKIPLMDPSTGRNFTINKFAINLRRFLRGLGLQFEENINGSTLYINFK